MIPDIALMILIAGAAGLLIGALNPHRLKPGSFGSAATILVWLASVVGIFALAVLAVDVLQKADNVSSILG